MLIGKILLKLVPFSVYHRFRTMYRSLNKMLHKPINEADFTSLLLNRMQIRKGDTVFVHCSVDKLNITFTPHKLLNILLETVGEEGTLLFPSWHFNYRAEEYLKKDLVFDVKRSPSVLGLLSELARRHPGAKRSLHPTSSIVAIGPKADYLLLEHHLSKYPCGDLSPFYKMLEFDAKIIGIGVNTEFLSFVHCPEDILKDDFPYNVRTQQIFMAKVKDYEGNIINVETRAAVKSIGNRNIPGYIRSNLSPQIAEDFKFKGNQFFRVNARLLFNSIIEFSAQGKLIYDQN